MLHLLENAESVEPGVITDRTLHWQMTSVPHTTQVNCFKPLSTQKNPARGSCSCCCTEQTGHESTTRLLFLLPIIRRGRLRGAVGVYAPSLVQHLIALAAHFHKLLRVPRSVWARLVRDLDMT